MDFFCVLIKIGQRLLEPSEVFLSEESWVTDFISVYWIDYYWANEGGINYILLEYVVDHKKI